MTLAAKMRFAVALSALMASSGCGALLGGGEPVRGFELRTSETVRAARHSSRHVTVELPETSGALATDLILIRPSRIEASYLPGTQWTNEAPAMVQTLLVRALLATEGFDYVGRTPLGLSGDYAILSELTDLQAEVLPEGQVVTKAALTLQIVRESDAAVLSSRSFAKSAAAASDSADDITYALDAATRAMLPEITRWVLDTTGVGVAR